jgi:hypothetical protein
VSSEARLDRGGEACASEGGGREEEVEEAVMLGAGLAVDCSYGIGTVVVVGGGSGACACAGVEW